MKKIILIFTIGVLLLVLSGCPILDLDPPGSNSESFLVGCKGNDSGLAAGLYKYEVGGTPEFITSYLPWAYKQQLMDYNNGILAYRVDPTPENTSGIAYMEKDKLNNVQFAPIPQAAKEGYYYRIAYSTEAGPKVFSDGRIAYLVYYETENPYDDYHVGMIAIFNPQNNEIEISGDPSGFVLSQPEKGSDTEGGSMEGTFLLSPDNNYLYCDVYGYGTDAGVYHEDYHFIVKYTVGEPGSYSRVIQQGGGLTAITSDGKYLIMNTSSGLQKINLLTNEMIKVDEYLFDFSPGNISPQPGKMIKYWPDGVGEYDFNGSPVNWTAIIDSKNTHGRILNAQYNFEGNKIYFTSTNDIYCHSGSETYIYSSEIIENNETPDSIGYLAPEFCTKIFLKL